MFHYDNGVTTGQITKGPEHLQIRITILLFPSWSSKVRRGISFNSDFVFRIAILYLHRETFRLHNSGVDVAFEFIISKKP